MRVIPCLAGLIAVVLLASCGSSNTGTTSSPSAAQLQRASEDASAISLYDSVQAKETGLLAFVQSFQSVNGYVEQQSAAQRAELVRQLNGWETASSRSASRKMRYSTPSCRRC